MNKRQTSKPVASMASKILKDGRYGKNVKSVAQISLTGGNMQKYEYILTRQAVPYEAITEDMIENICINLDKYDKPMNITVGDLSKKQKSTFRILLEDDLEILYIRQRPGWNANEQ